MSQNIYIHAWEHEDGNPDHVMFEITTRERYARDQVAFAGVVRGSKRVTVYCSYWHGQAPLAKAEMRDIARNYLNGKFITHSIDLSY